VAIIMDGNRRWARERGLSTIEGHRAGARALRRTARAARDAGIEVLTVYCFSEENWTRPSVEVRGLMQMFRHYARREQASLIAEGARVRVIGRIDELPSGPRAALDELVAATSHCTGLILNLAINYSARRELCDAVRSLGREVAAGRLDPEAIDERLIASCLYTDGLPDPDLLIRTGGELRLSNFLLYQAAYTEIWSTPRHWPSFDADLLGEALDAYAQRQRRFGR
ncbi:MAG TPA: polyprenyl diphosphate synthase, partial [Candidatus Baltobacteraceae bacterium]|nr:polyprenyl diphosphate synthase [Candidatus Baltobacteraceae bacterium]